MLTFVAIVAVSGSVQATNIIITDQNQQTADTQQNVMLVNQLTIEENNMLRAANTHLSNANKILQQQLENQAIANEENAKLWRKTTDDQTVAWQQKLNDQHQKHQVEMTEKDASWQKLMDGEIKWRDGALQHWQDVYSEQCTRSNMLQQQLTNCQAEVNDKDTQLSALNQQLDELNRRGCTR